MANILGDKPFYTSLTFWLGIVPLCLGYVIDALCGNNILPSGVCSVLGHVMSMIGTIGTIFGVRKAIGTNK